MRKRKESTPDPDAEATRAVPAPIGMEAEDAARDRHTPVKVTVSSNPSWWAPVMVALMVVGLLWLVVYYLSNFKLPISALGGWNMGVGFVLIMAGFIMTTNWK